MILVLAHFVSIFTYNKIAEYEAKLRKCDITIVYRDTCPHSIAALESLRHLPYQYYPVEEKSDPDFVSYVRGNYHPTFPAIFIRGALFGGNDKLQASLKDKSFHTIMEVTRPAATAG